MKNYEEKGCGSVAELGRSFKISAKGTFTIHRIQSLVHLLPSRIWAELFCLVGSWIDLMPKPHSLRSAFLEKCDKTQITRFNKMCRNCIMRKFKDKGTGFWRSSKMNCLTGKRREVLLKILEKEVLKLFVSLCSSLSQHAWRPKRSWSSGHASYLRLHDPLRAFERKQVSLETSGNS